MKKISIFVLFFMLSSILFAGGKKENTTTIGVTLLTQAHPFYQAIKDAIESEAYKQEVELTIAIADQDLNRQISQMEDFINKQVDAIIVTPVDSDGIAGGIQRAKSANIPVVTVDIKANGVEVDSHIATDNYSGGLIAAEAMAQYLEGKGKVGLLTYPEVQSVRDRIDGFKKQSENYPDISIVTELPGRTREEAKQASEDMLTANPDLRGIFGFGDDMAISATTAIEERGMTAVVVGFDGLQEARDFVDKNNVFMAVVRQFPSKMGAEGVKAALALINKQTVAKEIPIVPGLYIYGKGDVPVEINDGKIMLSVQ